MRFEMARRDAVWEVPMLSYVHARRLLRLAQQALRLRLSASSPRAPQLTPGLRRRRPCPGDLARVQSVLVCSMNKKRRLVEAIRGYVVVVDTALFLSCAMCQWRSALPLPSSHQDSLLVKACVCARVRQG